MREARVRCPVCDRKFQVTLSGALRRHACHIKAQVHRWYTVELRTGGRFTITQEFGLAHLRRDEQHLVSAIADAIQHYKSLAKEKRMGETVTIPAGTLIYVGGLPFRTITDTTVEGSAANLALGLEAVNAPRTSNQGGTTEASA